MLESVLFEKLATNFIGFLFAGLFWREWRQDRQKLDELRSSQAESDAAFKSLVIAIADKASKGDE